MKMATNHKKEAGQSSGAKILKKYGFKKIGLVNLEKNKFIINVEDSKITSLTNIVYVFVFNDEIVRIGSSKGIFGNRLHAWERDVTNRLNGINSSTPGREARAWRKLLKKYGHGLLFARQGTKVKTPIGIFPAYLDEESILIGRHLPVLNRNKHR